MKLQSGLAAFAFSGALALAAAMPAFGQQKQVVKFEAGNDNAAVEGEITGDQYFDYTLGASAGQTMSVSLITEGSAFFNILPPGSDNATIYNGSINGENASVQLPQDGDYTIRVYLMGNARDTGETVTYMVSMTIM